MSQHTTTSAPLRIPLELKHQLQTYVLEFNKDHHHKYDYLLSIAIIARHCLMLFILLSEDDRMKTLKEIANNIKDFEGEKLTAISFTVDKEVVNTIDEILFNINKQQLFELKIKRSRLVRYYLTKFFDTKSFQKKIMTSVKTELVKDS